MLTSDAKPDPPRTEINDNSSVLKTHSSVKYIPENNQEINARINSIVNPSFTKKLKNSLAQLKFSTPKNGNNGSIPDKGNNQINNRSQDFPQPFNNSMNFNIVNCSGVSIGSTTKYICNFNQFNKNLKNNDGKNDTFITNSSRKMSNDIKKWSTSKHELTIQDMYIIKTHIGYNWRQIFLSLGYSNGQLDQFTENHKSKGIGEIIYQILLDWKYANGRTAGIGKVIKILWTHKEYDCVERLVREKLLENSS